MENSRHILFITRSLVIIVICLQRAIANIIFLSIGVWYKAGKRAWMKATPDQPLPRSIPQSFAPNFAPLISMKNLFNLKRRFKASTSTEELIKSNRPLFQRFFLLSIALICLMLIFSIIKSAHSISWIWITLVCVPSSILLLFTTVLKNSRYLEIIIIICFLPAYGSLIYLQSRTMIFMEGLSSGYFFGVLERLLVERFPTFHHKAILGISACVIRLTVINNLNLYDYLLGALIPFLGLFMDFAKQAHERKKFKLLRNSRESFHNFKELFKTHLPENILIIQASLQECLFANDAFQKAFGLSTLPVTRDFLRQFTLEKENLTRAIDHLREAQISFERELSRRPSSNGIKLDDNIGSVGFLTDRDRNPSDLLSFLEALQRFEYSFVDPVFEYTFNYSTTETPEDFKVYKIKIFPFRWECQKTLAMVVTDVTEHYTVMNLKSADENKDRIVATISHELRTPLNAILGMIQLMEKETTQPLFAKYLKICGSSAKLLLSLINSILDMGQIKNNKLKLHPAKYKLKDVMNDIISLFDFQCQQKQLYLRLKIDKGLPQYVYTDKNRLAQIIINLVGNALKFTFQGGITILVDQDPSQTDCIRFSVIDTGVGIKDQEKDKLFKMYGKLEGSANLNTQGIGLGLHISNTLAKLLNEEREESGIKVESEYEKGSKFTFRLKKNLYNTEESASKLEQNVLSNKESILSELSKKRTSGKNEDIQSICENDIDPILSFDETDEDKDFNEQQAQDAIAGLSGKILKYHTLVNSSQHNLESSRFSRNFLTNYRDASATIGNLDQTYASPRMHLLSYASPFIHQYRRRLTFTNNNVSILVADDNAFNLMVAKELIEAQGLLAHTVLNGQQAVDQVIKKSQEKMPYKLILMDCEMPVMNGYEATKVLIKKMNKGEITKVPIVAVTANSVETTKEDCLKAGMIDCLGKPLIEGDLRQVITKYIKF